MKLNFEDFRLELETKLNAFAKIELLEFHFEPHSFGSGYVAYRIKGRNHKFVFNGRDNELSWLKSKPHQKYSTTNMTEIRKIKGLEISSEELEKGIMHQ